MTTARVEIPWHAILALSVRCPPGNAHVRGSSAQPGAGAKAALRVPGFEPDETAGALSPPFTRTLELRPRGRNHFLGLGFRARRPSHPDAGLPW